MNKQRVIVARNWGNPEIIAFVSEIEVGASMDLTQFLSAIVAEIGNPTMLFTTAILLKKVLDASEKIKKEMKESTKYL